MINCSIYINGNYETNVNFESVPRIGEQLNILSYYDYNGHYIINNVVNAISRDGTHIIGIHCTRI